MCRASACCRSNFWRQCLCGMVHSTECIPISAQIVQHVHGVCGATQVNARMGGGPVYAMNNFVWGVDMVEEQFLASCGIPSRPYMAKAPMKCIAEFSVNAQKTGKLLNTDWADVSPSFLTHRCSRGFSQILLSLHAISGMTSFPQACSCSSE